MSASRPDPEMLAALLDGRVSSAERDALVQALAASPEGLAVLAEAAVVLRELSAGDPVATIHDAPDDGVPSSPDDVHDTRSRAPRRSFLVPIAALAAAVLAVAVVMQPTGREPQALQVAEAMRMPSGNGTGSMARALGSGWDEPAWSITRGTESTRATASRAFRSGFRMTHVVVASRAQDAVAVRSAIGQLRQLLSDVEGAAPIAMRLDSVTRLAGADADVPLAELAPQVRALVGDSAWFDLGLWASAASLAARSGQAAFFDADGDAVGVLRRLLAEAPPPGARWNEVVQPLRAELARGFADEPARLPALTTILGRVIAAGGD